MIAILLAAGVGRRMGQGALPKCLLEIGGRSLLRRTLACLQSAGVREAVIVTGHESRAVAGEARRAAGRIRLHLLENSRYTEGAILSLWTARDFLGIGPVLVMDADVLAPQAAYERLIRSVHANAILVDRSAADTGEEQMVFARGARVTHITKRPAEALRREMAMLGESVGFLKLSAEGARILRDLLERAVAAGMDQIEHEQIYPELFRRTRVGWETMKGLAWTEIDTPADLAKARQEIYPRWIAPPAFNRVLSNLFLPAVLRLPISANAWTVLSLGVGLAAVLAFWRGTPGSLLAGGLLFELCYLIDNWDGEVARHRGTTSAWGGWFDIAVDAVVQTLLPLGLAAGLDRAGGAPAWLWPAAACAALGVAFDFGVTGWAKRLGFGPGIHSDPARAAGGGRWRRLRANLSNENFSLLLLAVVLSGAVLPFLAVLAAGTHLYWARFLLKHRKRLFRMKRYE